VISAAFSYHPTTMLVVLVVDPDNLARQMPSYIPLNGAEILPVYTPDLIAQEPSSEDRNDLSMSVISHLSYKTV
jgi:hypothetical protein